jgi:tetratricopeptide (TPR) repeat protein/Mg-chelatase subunit ChlD
LRYLQLLPQAGGRFRYLYPMQGETPVRIGEFSLTVDLGDEGRKLTLTTLADARIEDGGKKVSIRRSGFTPRADFLLEARPSSSPEPLRVARFEAGADQADYVMMRYVPDIDFSKAKPPRGDVVVVVDTSAGGDDASRALKTATAEAILRALSADDRFALIALDVTSKVLYPASDLASAKPSEIGKAMEKLAEHGAGGATDLGSFFDPALARVHGGDQPAVVYVGDGVPSSGETRGERLVERLRQALATSRARLFTVGVGVMANRPLLESLARAGGGEFFHVDSAEIASERALRLVAALKTPTLTDFTIDLGAGLDEVFTSANGKVQQGHEVAVLARTHHDIPAVLKVKGRLGGEQFTREYRWKSDPGVLTAFVPRLWAAEYLRRLLGSAEDPELMRGKVMQIGIAFGLMTPFNSILALESEMAYQQQGIQRRKSPLRGVRLSAITPAQEAGALALDVMGAVATIGLGCGSKDEPAEKKPAARMHAFTDESRQMVAQSPAGAATYKYEQIPSGELGATTPPVPPVNMDSALGGVASMEEAIKKADKGGIDLGKPKFGAPKKDKWGGSGGGAPAEAKKSEKVPFASKGMQKMSSGGGGGGGRTHFSAPRRAMEPSPPLQPPPPPPPPQPVRLDSSLKACSDAAARPLYERMILWAKRLRTASNGQQLIDRYVSARRSCELNDWHAESNFLYLLQAQLKNEGDVSYVLRSFAGDRETQIFLARLILRRTVDDRVVVVIEGLLFGEQVNWANVDNDLATIRDPAARLERIRQILVRAPADPKGLMRLIHLLVENGKLEDALAQGRRLRDTGLATPFVVRELGDLLAGHKLDEEAIRTYSEIVEFDPQNLASRRLLGDVYLAHGWYEPAYQQYKMLSELAPAEAQYWLRLAMAAAGTGRVDEALRLERTVASSPGRPGPADPRRWAQLWSAARLARLLSAPIAGSEGADLAAGMKSKLKELQLFKGPATLVIVTWEDLSADVTLGTVKDGTQLSVGQATDAAPAGLSAVLISPDELSKIDLQVFMRSPTRKTPVGFTRQVITYDGKGGFDVKVTAASLPAEESKVTL